MIKIGEINTKPEIDPYNVSTGGYSYTCLKLDCVDKEVYVTQEYRTNSMSAREFNRFVLTWKLCSHPHESQMKEYIEEHLEMFQTIVNGFEIDYSRGSAIGVFTEEARHVIDTIERSIDIWAKDYMYYEFYLIEDWVGPITHEIEQDTTDEEVRQIAKRIINDLDANVVLSGDEDDIYEYLIRYRDES